MSSELEYHPRMRYWTPVFTVFLAASFSLCASAQANGVPPSVTSFGFGGHPGFNGAPASVTSPGPRGATPQHGPHQPQFHPPGAHQHHHQNQGYAYPYYVPYYIPYSPLVDPSDAPEESAADVAEDPNQYQGGPTIFDRRGSGMTAPNDYRQVKPQAAIPKPSTPVATPAMQTETVTAAPAATKAPEPIVIAQPATILVFKDGHKQEVSNYAIVGSNLFDITPGHRLKIALSDLDLNATQKANEDEGIDFKLPGAPGS